MEFDVKAAVAEGLKAIREEKGESQDAVAKAIGSSRVTVNRWENGKQTPNAAQLYTAANYLGTTTDAVFNTGEAIVRARTAITTKED